MGDDVEECPRCNGSGEIAVSTRTFQFRAPGPVPEDARGVVATKCDECRGTGYVEKSSTGEQP